MEPLQLQINPTRAATIGPGDIPVAIGEASKLATMKDLAGKKGR